MSHMDVRGDGYVLSAAEKDAVARTITAELRVVRHGYPGLLATVPAYMVEDIDLKNAAWARVLRHYHRFDPEQGNKLTTFLAHHARGGMLDHIRRLAPGTRTKSAVVMSFDAPFASDEDGDFSLHDITPSPGDEHDDALVRMTLTDARSTALTDTEDHLVTLHMGGFTTTEIAEGVGTTQNAIQQRLRAIRLKLKNARPDLIEALPAY